MAFSATTGNSTKSLMFDTFQPNYAPIQAQPQPLQWMPSFDSFNPNGPISRDLSVEIDDDLAPLTALFDESESVTSTSTRDELGFGYPPSKRPKIQKQHSLDLGLGFGSLDNAFDFFADDEELNELFDGELSVEPSQATKPLKAPRVRTKKEHPSSNTATLKKRQGLTTSKFNGVCWNKRKMKWRARLSNKGTREFLGDFDTEEEAARAFDKRIKQLMPAKKYMDKLNFKDEEESDAHSHRVLESKASCSSFVSI